MDSNKLDLVGKWFLPGSDKKIDGVLKYEPTIGGVLTLDVSASFDNTSYSSERTYQYDFIMGDCNGKKITLNNCIENKTNFEIKNSSLSAISEFYVSYVFVGIHFTKQSDVIFDEFSFHFFNSEFWFNVDSFNIKSNNSITSIFKYYIPDYFDLSLTILHTNGIKIPYLHI